MTERLLVEASREAPQLVRRWLASVLTVSPIRASEAALLASELVGRAVAGPAEGRIEVTTDATSTGWRVTVDPAAAPDDLTSRLLDRFSARWAGADTAAWFEVRGAGTVAGALESTPTEDLLAAVGDDADARDEIVRRFTPMALDISRRYRRKGIPDGDLEQAAVLGVLRALDRFDPEAGEFQRYAASTVSGELKRLLRDRAWSVRVPRGLQERALEVSRARESMTQRLGRPPTTAELADELGVPIDEVVEALGAGSAYTAASIDAPTPGRSIGETLSDGGDPHLEMVERLGDLTPAVEALPDRERTILRLRFVEELSQADIAERVGVSQMHVSRLLRRSIAELRDRLD